MSTHSHEYRFSSAPARERQACSFMGMPLLIISFLLITTSSPARDWIVSPETGADTNEGTVAAPLATAQAAVDKSGLGDRIVLQPAGSVYRQSIDLSKAPPGLVLDGNGVTLSGADPIPNEAWEDVGDGKFRTLVSWVSKQGPVLIQGAGKDYVSVADTSIPQDVPAQVPSFSWNAISDNQIQLILNQKPISSTEIVRRDHGLVSNGECRNIKIFNLSAKHFLGAGFAISGNSRGLQFFGISSNHNFGNGFEAGGNAECWIHGGNFTDNRYSFVSQGSASSFHFDSHYGGYSGGMSLEGGRHSLTRCSFNSRVFSRRILSIKGAQGEQSSEAATLVIQSLNVISDSEEPPKPSFEIGPGSFVYHDASSKEALAELEVSVHPSSELRESLYHTFAIGRNGTGSPLMAWAGGATRTLPSQAYRIIHFGKFVPQDVAPKLLPDNDWLGLLAPLDTADFPPAGPAFGPGTSSAHAIWRWIGLTAPDAVFVPDSPEGRALGKALQEHPPAGVGMVNVFINRESPDGSQESFVLPNTLDGVDMAKVEMQERVRRSPQEVLNQLSEHYGHHFSGSYIEALALIAKEEAGITNRSKELAREFLGKAPDPPANGGEIAGALLYAGIDEPWARERVLKVAGIAFDPQGNPLEAMPFHNEMSDAVFMASPLLARAGEISGEKRYFDQCLRNFTFISDLCRRPDGLYRHSPLTEAAWGRGNGFPALGLALVLPHFPEEDEGFPILLAAFRDHLSALAKHQDTNGMWHQIIDHPDSYAEFTATCMIAYAAAVGLENEWLEPDWHPRLELAWNAIKMHISTDGKTLINVCTGTGKQPGLDDYYRREAILGSDSRGGAMALMLAAKMKKRYTQ